MITWIASDSCKENVQPMLDKGKYLLSSQLNSIEQIGAVLLINQIPIQNLLNLQRMILKILI
jgi:hypothetical protein